MEGHDDGRGLHPAELVALPVIRVLGGDPVGVGPPTVGVRRAVFLLPSPRRSLLGRKWAG